MPLGASTPPEPGGDLPAINRPGLAPACSRRPPWALSTLSTQYDGTSINAAAVAGRAA